MMIFEASVLPEPDSPEITIHVSFPDLFIVLYAERKLQILDFQISKILMEHSALCSRNFQNVKLRPLAQCGNSRS